VPDVYQILRLYCVSRYCNLAALLFAFDRLGTGTKTMCEQIIPHIFFSVYRMTFDTAVINHVRYVYIHCGAKKLHHFISAITSTKRFTLKYLSVRIYSSKFGTKRHQNRQPLLKHIFTVLCETQHACVFVTNVTLA